MESLEQKTPSFSLADVPPRLIALIALLVIAFVASYWHTMLSLATTWLNVADYSHGFIVIPFAIFVLWTRRDRFPHGRCHPSWWGVPLLLLVIGMRYLGGFYNVTSPENASVVVWVAAVCFCLGGWQFFKWALPGIAFLVFMVPLPNFVAKGLRLPLQKISTKLSTFVLQCMGQPAISEENTIWLGTQQLEVEEACSGIRIFMIIVFCACCFIVVTRPKWWQALAMLLAIVPVALLTNATRIVVTGLLYAYTSSEVVHKFSHDIAGYMMPLIAGLMFLFLFQYLRHLVKDVPVVGVGEVLARRE